jgi:hypothetical protein
MRTHGAASSPSLGVVVSADVKWRTDELMLVLRGADADLAPHPLADTA